MREVTTKKNVTAGNKSADAKAKKPFHIVEAYKSLRTNLLFTLATADRKSVVVTSAEPHAGKSTTVANLSSVMAQTNFKVLVIDADMRSPSIDRIFRISRNQGLSKVLSGMQAWEQAVVKQVAPNLDILPAGPLPPNPQELLCSDAMVQLLKEAEEKYDYIFIDTPPVNVVADALMLTKEIAGMLLAVREGQTTYDDIRLAQESVQSVDGRILGVLLTDVKQRANVYRERYYKASNYSYGR